MLRRSRYQRCTSRPDVPGFRFAHPGYLLPGFCFWLGQRSISWCGRGPWSPSRKWVTVRRNIFVKSAYDRCGSKTAELCTAPVAVGPLRPESGRVGRHLAKSALCHWRPNAPQKKAKRFDHVVSEREQLSGTARILPTDRTESDANLSQLT